MAWGVAVLGWVLGAQAVTAAQPPAAVVRDWGLHRQWAVERDREHPAGPARLVEEPWTAPRPASGKAVAARGAGRATAPVVRAGRRVSVWRRQDEAEIRMTGTALESGGLGEPIRVRAGWSNATLRGIVRGPDSVELAPRGSVR